MSLNEVKCSELQKRALTIRERTIEIIINGGGGHLGGDMSEADVLVNLFDLMKHDPNNPHMKDRDMFILSKAHSAETYYALLEYYGYIKAEEVNTLGKFGSKFGGHPTRKINGVEVSGGSLGHGLGLAVGKALALRMDGMPNHVYVMTGDGELAEGSNWEAAMSAGKFGLENLTWIIDRNGLQISGSTEDVMPLDDLAKKAEAFGLYPVVIDGHDHYAIRDALELRVPGKSVCVIARTIKGKGFTPAENRAEWHHKTPTAEQFEEMKKETAEKRKELGDE